MNDRLADVSFYFPTGFLRFPDFLICCGRFRVVFILMFSRVVSILKFLYRSSLRVGLWARLCFREVLTPPPVCLGDQPRIEVNPLQVQYVFMGVVTHGWRPLFGSERFGSIHLGVLWYSVHFEILI